MKKPSLILLLVTLTTWQLLATNSKEFTFLFSSPLEILYRIIKEYNLGLSSLFSTNPSSAPQETFLYDLLITTTEIILGLALGSIISLIIAYVMSANSFIKDCLTTYINLASSIPAFAISPMLIIWFGIGMKSKVFLSALTVLFSGVPFLIYEIEKRLINFKEYFTSLNTTNLKITLFILVPATFSLLLQTASLNINNALLGAFIGETISSQNGIAHFIVGCGTIYDISGVFVGVVHLSLISLGIKRILNFI